MTENDESFFTPKHKRLERIASTANIFAWLVLIFFALQAFAQYFNLMSMSGYRFNLEMFRENPEGIIVYFLNMLNLLLKGVVYWLTLKGVSLGLSMIVETDLNYREKLQGASHE